MSNIFGVPGIGINGDMGLSGEYGKSIHYIPTCSTKIDKVSSILFKSSSENYENIFDVITIHNNRIEISKQIDMSSDNNSETVTSFDISIKPDAEIINYDNETVILENISFNKIGDTIYVSKTGNTRLLNATGDELLLINFKCNIKNEDKSLLLNLNLDYYDNDKLQQKEFKMSQSDKDKTFLLYLDLQDNDLAIDEHNELYLCFNNDTEITYDKLNNNYHNLSITSDSSSVYLKSNLTLASNLYHKNNILNKDNDYLNIISNKGAIKFLDSGNNGNVNIGYNETTFDISINEQANSKVTNLYVNDNRYLNDSFYYKIVDNIILDGSMITLSSNISDDEIKNIMIIDNNAKIEKNFGESKREYKCSNNSKIIYYKFNDALITIYKETDSISIKDVSITSITPSDTSINLKSKFDDRNVNITGIYDSSTDNISIELKITTTGKCIFDSESTSSDTHTIIIKNGDINTIKVFDENNNFKTTFLISSNVSKVNHTNKITISEYEGNCLQFSDFKHGVPSNMIFQIYELKCEDVETDDLDISITYKASTICKTMSGLTNQHVRMEFEIYDSSTDISASLFSGGFKSINNEQYITNEISVKRGDIKYLLILLEPTTFRSSNYERSIRLDEIVNTFFVNKKDDNKLLCFMEKRISVLPLEYHFFTTADNYTNRYLLRPGVKLFYNQDTHKCDLNYRELYNTIKVTSTKINASKLPKYYSDNYIKPYNNNTNFLTVMYSIDPTITENTKIQLVSDFNIIDVSARKCNDGISYEKNGIWRRLVDDGYTELNNNTWISKKDSVGSTLYDNVANAIKDKIQFIQTAPVDGYGGGGGATTSCTNIDNLHLINANYYNGYYKNYAQIENDISKTCHYPICANIDYDMTIARGKIIDISTTYNDTNQRFPIYTSLTASGLFSLLECDKDVLEHINYINKNAGITPPELRYVGLSVLKDSSTFVKMIDNQYIKSSGNPSPIYSCYFSLDYDRTERNDLIFILEPPKLSSYLSLMKNDSTKNNIKLLPLSFMENYTNWRGNEDSKSDFTVNDYKIE